MVGTSRRKWDGLAHVKTVRNQIRERRSNLLRSTIQTRSPDGMHPRDKSLVDLYRQGVITYETAMAHAVTPEYIKQSSAVTTKRVVPQR